MDVLDWPVKGHTAKLVLLALAVRENAQTGKLCPSLSRLAKDTALDRRTVQRALDQLERDGWIERFSTPRVATDYHILVAECPQTGGSLPPELGAECPQQESHLGAHNHQAGGTAPPNWGQAAAQNRKEQEGNRERGRKAPTPPAGSMSIEDAMDAAEAAAHPERSDSPVIQDHGPTTPIEGTFEWFDMLVTDLIVAHGAIVRDDRDVWRDAIRVHGIEAVRACLQGVRSSGRRGWWSSVQQALLDQPEEEPAAAARPWRELALEGMCRSLEWGGIPARIMRDAAEAHSGRPLNQDAPPIQVANYVLKHCPDVIDRFIERGWLPPNPEVQRA